MKACDDRIAQLVDAAEGDASAELAEHLGRCEGCRRELDSFRATTQLLERTRNEPADLTLAGFAHRVTDAAELRRDGTLRGLWRRLEWRQRFSVGIGAGACAALGAAVVLALGAAPEIGASGEAMSTKSGTAGLVATFERGQPDAEEDGSTESEDATDIEALLLAWDGVPLPSLDDGFGDLAEDDVLTLTDLLAVRTGFAEETL